MPEEEARYGGRCRLRATARAAEASHGARRLFGGGGHDAEVNVQRRAARRAPRINGAACSEAGLITPCRGETRGATGAPAQSCKARKGTHANDPAARSRSED
eukprot:scaffold44113_cov60-Phaeocystis_antarctica.AAC.1